MTYGACIRVGIEPLGVPSTRMSTLLPSEASTGSPLLQDLPTLPEAASPWVAAGAGLLLGAVGLGLYFRSWRDAFTGFLLGFVAFAMLFLFVGLTALVGAAVATAALAIWRVHDSRLRRRIAELELLEDDELAEAPASS